MIKKLFVFIISFMLYYQSSAQLLGYNGGKFTIQSPNHLPLYIRSNSIGDTTHCMAYVLEYGNGFFSVNPPNGLAYTYASGKPTTQSYLSFFARYDTIKPPPIVAYEIPEASTGTDSEVVNPTKSPEFFSDTENIRVTSITKIIRPSEENLIIITYKLPPNFSKGTILFYYNEANFEVFEKVDGETFTENPLVKSIRTGYFGESIDITVTENALLQQNIFLNKINGRSYKHVLVFNVSEETKGEKNIFITLKSKESLPQASKGFFEAVLIPQFDKTSSIDDGAIDNEIDTSTNLLESIIKTGSVEMTASLNPHDPNFIQVVPKCIEKGTGTSRIHYHVHCQNDGTGENYELSIKINMDKKLLAGIDTSTIRVKVAGQKRPRSNFIFVMTDSTFELMIKLQGLPVTRNVGPSLFDNSVPASYCNPLTMGDVYFDVVVDNRIETDLAAFATIIFHNRDGDTMAGVDTKKEILVIRDKCKDYLYDYPNLDTQKCCIFLGLCCWWWLIILIGIAIIIWFILRRRRNRQAYDQT